MTLDDIKQDQHYQHRTQISLSKSMYRRLMQEKGSRSLAEHVRQLILQVWEAQHQQLNSKQQSLHILNQPMTAQPPSIDELLAQERSLRRERQSHE